MAPTDKGQVATKSSTPATRSSARSRARSTDPYACIEDELLKIRHLQSIARVYTDKTIVYLYT